MRLEQSHVDLCTMLLVVFVLRKQGKEKKILLLKPQLWNDSFDTLHYQNRSPLAQICFSSNVETWV